MQTFSLRDNLRKIGEIKPERAFLAIPSGFHSTPRSLKTTMHAMLSPQIENWTNTHQSTFENEVWTEECQGLTTDGQYWYLSSNNEDFRAIHKFTLDFTERVGAAELPSGSGDHLGDVDFHDGKIYVSVDDPESKVWVLDRNLNTLRIAKLDASFFVGWCAINPWNGFLYTSDGNGVDRIHVYDPNNNFEYKGFLALSGPPINGLQGGCFSANGHLYVTSDRYVAENATKDIRAYSALNGAFLGSCPVSYDTSTLEREEMEGITIAHLIHGGGVSTYVSVVILDNDLGTNDDIFIKHFAVPVPNVL